MQWAFSEQQHLMELTQLNFLGNYLDTRKEQLELFTDKLEPLPKARSPKYVDVEQFFVSLDKETVDKYKEYWSSVAPKNRGEEFKRWLFAFMSVHTSWKSNVAGYNAIKDYKAWKGDDKKLLQLIKDSGVGLHNNRTRYISAFAKEFWDNKKWYNKKKDETWVAYRNRLESTILGLGPAKTSFSLEMCYPTEAHVTCLDTHLFQVYGVDQSKDLRLYSTLETHWLDMSRMWNVPAYIARCIWWDRKQGKEDSRYWSYCLEG